MDISVVTYLGDLAHRCVRLARNCPHIQTQHGLEELAAELMAKALEIEDLLGSFAFALKSKEWPS
jgi:hypothetical protein